MRKAMAFWTMRSFTTRPGTTRDCACHPTSHHIYPDTWPSCATPSNCSGGQFSALLGACATGIFLASSNLQMSAWLSEHTASVTEVVVFHQHKRVCTAGPTAALNFSRTPPPLSPPSPTQNPSPTPTQPYLTPRGYETRGLRAKAIGTCFEIGQELAQNRTGLP